MCNLTLLYDLIYKKHLRDTIDENNSIHLDIKKILLGKTADDKKFAGVIELIEQKVSRELTDEISVNLKNGILEDVYFKANKLEINEESINKITEIRSVKNVQLNENPITTLLAKANLHKTWFNPETLKCIASFPADNSKS